MRGVRLPVLLGIILVSLIVSFTFSYVAVVSQNPKPVSSPLYGPGDYATQTP